VSAETVPNVQQAWANVMAEVQGLGKHQRTDSGNRFNFRGVDDVMNAVGPVLRKHGVSVVPTAVTHHPENYSTKSGTAMRNVTVLVSYAIHGPAGDTMPGAAAGEAADSGDKATPKAMSVAFRTFLLQSLCLPTDEPDPDREQHERAPEQSHEARQAQAQDTADKLLVTNDLATVQRVHAWATERGLIATEVADADGELLPLGALFARIQAKLEAAAGGEAA
jgi:hypothetical protein